MAKTAKRTEEQLSADRARIISETDAGVAAHGEATARLLEGYGMLKPPVDTEDDDRRLSPAAPPVNALTGEPSVRHDEHRGLAARLLDLRKLVEDHRQLAVRDAAQLNQRMAQLEQQVTAMATRIDHEVERMVRRHKDLDDALRQGGEQVRVAGELGRKMTDQVKVLEELREMASDPHEVIKPLQRGLATLRGDVETLAKTIDIRFEQMPKGRSEPIESRSEDEQALVKLGTEIRKLKERIGALEA